MCTTVVTTEVVGKWSQSRFNLKVEPTKFADALNMWSKRKKHQRRVLIERYYLDA